MLGCSRTVQAKVALRLSLGLRPEDQQQNQPLDSPSAQHGIITIGPRAKRAKCAVTRSITTFAARWSRGSHFCHPIVCLAMCRPSSRSPCWHQERHIHGDSSSAGRTACSRANDAAQATRDMQWMWRFRDPWWYHGSIRNPVRTFTKGRPRQLHKQGRDMSDHLIYS